MPDFLTKKRGELEKRLRELRPLHEEYVRLERALNALGTLNGRSAPSPEGRRRGRRASSGKGRPGGDSRADQALAVVRANPGITVSELGDKLGVKQKNYLYRVMNNLHAKGSVRKRGRGYSAA